MKQKGILIIGGLIIVSVIAFAAGKGVLPAIPGMAGSMSNVSYDYSVKPTEGVPIKVARVIDGDTIVLANGDSLRYIGMDTPEEVNPQKPLQCYAREAAAANKALVEGQTITFYKDQTEKDQYGRWLGYVYLADGTFVNLSLVKSGYAFAYPYKPDISKEDQFAAAQASAKTAGLGLWSHCTVTTLSDGREQTNAIGPIPTFNN